MSDENEAIFESVQSDEILQNEPLSAQRPAFKVLKKCIRKGDRICYSDLENVTLLRKIAENRSDPHEVPTNTETVDNVQSGESLYKTYDFEQSVYDEETEKCIAFWKTVMEKNMEPIKCAIIESEQSKKRQSTSEKISKSEEIALQTEEEEADADVYRKKWITAVKDIQRKRLHQIKLIGKERYKMCESISSVIKKEASLPTETKMKENLLELNDWVPKSTGKQKDIGRTYTSVEPRREPRRKSQTSSMQDDSLMIIDISEGERTKTRSISKLKKSSTTGVYESYVSEKRMRGNPVYEAFTSFFKSETPRNKVIDAKPDSFSSRGIHVKEDRLVLYLPMPSKNDKNYEIVLYPPTTDTLSSRSYSLYRTPAVKDAEVRFVTLKDKLPVFVEVCPKMCDIRGLQKICDVLTDHPTWTLAHLAAHCNIYDAFNSRKIKAFLNNADQETGMSPLQVAVTANNLKTVQKLVRLKASLEHLDHNRNSVFHFAAGTSKDIISVLAQASRSPKCLNDLNKNGNTPLDMACHGDKLDCVKALVLAGADVNEGTPLHWSCSRPVIEALIDMNCHINAVNFENRTALHIMVLCNRLDCVAALLSRHADVDIRDNKGDRPIHLAVRQGLLPIIQCLIIFGTDLDLVNKSGQSARHLVTKEQEPKLLYYLHAVGAKRCLKDVYGCTDGCRYDGTYDGIPPPRVLGPTNRDILNQMLSVAGMEQAAKEYKGGKIPKKGRLLCLDGGGIRGLVLVQMLLEIEKVMGRPVVGCFDWLAGTSTGGILALAMATGKTMKECQCLYFRLKDTTFVGYRPYSSEGLENVLKETFGKDTVMSDIPYPRVMITGILADRKPCGLHLFRNYKSPNDILNVKHDPRYELPPPPKDQYNIWQVGRATGAAPTFFRAFRQFLDGGLIANNPTLDALTEIHEHHLALKSINKEEEACPVSVVVSLGTGVAPAVVLEDMQADVQKPESWWDSAKVLMGLPALGELLIERATATDGRVVDRARSWCSCVGVPYFRFSPQMSEEVAMDEKSDEKLCKMLWETKAYMYEHQVLVKELVGLITTD